MLTFLYQIATDRYSGPVASAIKSVLLVLSFFYRLAVKFLIWCYQLKPYRAACIVVSVGNITVGGTGKTPLVELIAQSLQDRRHKVAIITRGYRRPSQSKKASAATFEAMGDEPYMLKRKLNDIPVIVDSDRIRAIRQAVSSGCDTVVLDDGFQQWRIKKDLEIVTINAQNPFGNGKLIPRGIMRQPLSSLKKADIFVLTNVQAGVQKEELEVSLRSVNPRAVVVEAEHEAVGFYRLQMYQEFINPSRFANLPVALVCGIGNPDSFKQLIMEAGIPVSLNFTFPDHYRYRNSDLETIAAACKEDGIKTIITTEKDASRLGLLPVEKQPFSVYVVRIALRIRSHEQEFFTRLHSLYPV